MRIRSLLLLVVFVVFAPACKSFKKGYDEEFKKSYAKEFGVTCAKAAIAKGAPEARATTACDCLAAFLVAHHTTSELTKLSLSPTSDESQAMFKEAGAACRAGATK